MVFLLGSGKSNFASLFLYFFLDKRQQAGVTKFTTAKI